jgi:hypothetical protein
VFAKACELGLGKGILSRELPVFYNVQQEPRFAELACLSGAALLRPQVQGVGSLPSFDLDMLASELEHLRFSEAPNYLELSLKAETRTGRSRPAAKRSFLAFETFKPDDQNYIRTFGQTGARALGLRIKPLVCTQQPTRDLPDHPHFLPARSQFAPHPSVESSRAGGLGAQPVTR